MDNAYAGNHAAAGDVTAFFRFVDLAAVQALLADVVTGIQTYLEEFGDRTLADAALSGGTRQAVFDSALDILYVDMNADAAINEADDLFIYLSGVTNLTSGTDLVGMII